MKRGKQKIFKRPSRIVLIFQCSFSGQRLGESSFPYDPVKMLNKWYSNYVFNWKRIVGPSYKNAEMLHGKILTKIELIY